MTIHKLKTWPTYFTAVKEGRKPFEVRKNDRHFTVGDQVLLEEFVPENYYEDQEKEHYTGEILHRRITYVLPGGNFGVEKEYVVFGLEKI